MSKLKMLLLCGVAFGLMFSPVARADRYVVAPGTPGANPESPYDTWARAATNIQLAVDAASAGETIWVSNGTYKATAGAGTIFRGVTTMVYIAKDVILRSVNGPDVTTLDGGYPDITNRPVAVNSIGAVFSGFTVVNGRAGVGGGILLGDNGGMASNCVVYSNVSDSALNEGGGSYNSGGGGIASSSTGYVYNCSIYNNTAISNNGGGAWMNGQGVMRGCKLYANTSLFESAYGGGGCYIRGEDIKVSQCVFSNNAAGGYGGGVYMYFGATVLDDCSIVNNSSTNGGGGCFAYYGGANALITNCVISGNTTTAGAGGGCSLRADVGYFKIVNSKIIGNEARTAGGGVDTRSGKVVLMDCLIANNYAIQQYGGGIRYDSTKPDVAEIMNCNIRENRAAYRYGGGGARLAGPCRMVGCLVISNVVTSQDSRSIGAGLLIASGSAVCENNTVVGNIVSNGTGGGIYMSSAGQVNNTIIYDNTSRVGENQDWMATAGTFSNCCAADTDGMNGSGNIAADPEFSDAAAGNYRLTVASPCVNAGLNQDWMIAGVDKDGRPRLDRFVKLVDIGCYEYHAQGTMFFVK